MPKNPNNRHRKRYQELSKFLDIYYSLKRMRNYKIQNTNYKQATNYNTKITNVSLQKLRGISGVVFNL